MHLSECGEKRHLQKVPNKGNEIGNNKVLTYSTTFVGFKNGDWHDFRPEFPHFHGLFTSRLRLQRKGVLILPADLESRHKKYTNP